MRAVLACAAAALLAGLMYANALHNPFIYDDQHTVVANPSLLPGATLRAIALHDVKRPLVNATYAIDRARAGSAPYGFHVTNLLLHALNVALLFQLARRLRDDDSPLVPFTAAALFAVHPMMTEAVGYVSGRSELLSGVFFLAAMLCGLRWMRGGGARWLAPVVACWVLALASKETAAMLPFVLAAADRLTAHGPPESQRRRLWRVHVPLMTAAVAAGLVRLFVLMRIEYPGQARLHWDYALLALDVIVRYIGLIVVPYQQTIFHSVAGVGGWSDPRVIVAVAVIGAMLILAWRLRDTQGMASLGLLWFLLLLAPAAALTTLDSGEPMAEHRVYLASCGLFLAAGSSIGWLRDRLSSETDRSVLIASAFVAVVIAALGAETVLRNRLWSDPVAVWLESVDLAPAHPRPRLLLGEALEDEGRRAEAIVQYQTAIRLKPRDVTGYLKLATCLAGMGDFDRAREAIAEALAIEPSNETVRRAATLLAQVKAAT